MPDERSGLSSRPVRAPQTTSWPPRQRSTNSRTSAGGSCRSAGMTIVMSARVMSACDDVDDRGDHAVLIRGDERRVHRQEQRSRRHLFGDGQRHTPEPPGVERFEMDWWNAAAARNSALDERTKYRVAVVPAVSGQQYSVGLERMPRVLRSRGELQLAHRS